MTDKPWVRSCYLVAFLVLMISSISPVSAEESNEAFIYCFPESNSSDQVLRYFDGRSDWNVTIYSLNDPARYERFFEIVNMLIIFAIRPQIPRETCLACTLRHFRWEELVMSYDPPLIGFFRKGELTVVTIGLFESKSIDQTLQSQIGDGVEIYTSNETCTLNDRAVKAKLHELFAEQGIGKGTGPDISGLLPSLLLLALSDSVNPCTFAVFTALLLMALHFSGRNRATIIGVSFVLAIFVGYYALGVGLLQVLVNIPYAGKIVAIMGLFVGAFSLIKGLRPEFRSPIPKALQTFTGLWLGKSYVSSGASFILGLVASLTLLPCTSGPYIVGLGLLSSLKPVHGYVLLALYNVIFVAPLILILITVPMSSRYARKIKVFRSKKLGILELISGIALVVVCAYILLVG